MNTPTPAREGLPELPEPHCAPFSAVAWYTAAQMHAYALAAIAGREAQGGGEVAAHRWLRNGVVTQAGWIDGVPSENQIRAQERCKDFAVWTVEYAYSAALPHPQPESGGKSTFDPTRPPRSPADSERSGSATTPPPPNDAAQGVHVRHIGGGLLALYRGDEQVREIGVTPGWNFRDRDEFIVRYNAHKGEGNG